MCGIAGVVSSKLGPAEREEAVRRMIARQRHRGPDDEGFVSDGPATIGMCRLSIFDPANGRQPMTTADGRFQLVFNGAIYNHRELRAELEPLGWSFRTNCDTEVLLHAFAQWGEGCLKRLRGMFAFAVWDVRERRLFAARGPLGLKPLYYARRMDDTFVFASELNGLLAGGLVPREIDPVAVGDYLAWFAVPAPRTIYRGISNLPPGHAVSVDANGRCRTFAWWQLPEAGPASGEKAETRNLKLEDIQRDSALRSQPSALATAPQVSGLRSQPSVRQYRDFVRELRSRLEDTIKAHRLADVPVGAFLSGGLDSSAVVGLMSSTGAAKLKTFSLVFDEAEYSEREVAAATARHFGTEHHEEVLTGSRVAADLPRILGSFDQPTGDGINTYYVSQAAHAGGVRVALSGLGGDELFGGYPSFRDMPQMARLLPWWRQVPRKLRGTAVGWLRGRDARMKKLADFLEHARDLHELCSLRRRVLPEQSRLELLAPEAERLARRQGPNHPMLDDFVFELMGADEFQICSAWEMRTYMADVLLRDSDVFSMAHSLELRVPFVDKNFVEWWWNQPRAFKWDARRQKSALADAVRGLVPETVIDRPKQGFTLPFARWMRSELKPFLDDTFSDSSLAGCPWLETKAVLTEWRDYNAGSDDKNWSRIWTLAVLIAFANRKPVDGGQ